MEYEELQAKIADIEKVYKKRYLAEMQNWYKYQERCISLGKVVVKPAPEESEFKRLAFLAVNKARKDYLMKHFPVRVGDMVEVVSKGRKRNGLLHEAIQYLRVKEIFVHGVDNPILKFAGKWFKRDGKEYFKQPENKRASQNDIRRYGPNIKNLKPIINNEESED
jgi:hypothetical protein